VKNRRNFPVKSPLRKKSAANDSRESAAAQFGSRGGGSSGRWLTICERWVTAAECRGDTMLSEFKTAFFKGARGTVRYGYFAPLTAAWLFATRSGSYGWHLKALYRLAFWRGKLYP